MSDRLIIGLLLALSFLQTCRITAVEKHNELEHSQMLQRIYNVEQEIQ